MLYYVPGGYIRRLIGRGEFCAVWGIGRVLCSVQCVVVEVRELCMLHAVYVGTRRRGGAHCWILRPYFMTSAPHN
jgi:hypothetical protein